MKKIKLLLLTFIMVFLLTPVQNIYAAGATDEILDYTITVHVNEDATLDMQYHISWKVLDDVQYGPLDWVQIGIPNSHIVKFDSLSDNIESMELMDGYEPKIRIDFNKKYYADDICEFDYVITQDYMYEMNVLTEGESVFYYTPGWFDDIAVDNISVVWDMENALSWSHGASVSDGMLTWTGSLAPGKHFDEVSVTYSTDAFAFDESKTVSMSGDGTYYESSYYEDDDDDAILGAGCIGFVIFVVLISVLGSKYSSYNNRAGFGSSNGTKKKITRTLITYYPTCPGCGAVRPENSEKCEYCGRSFIKSEEVVEEKELYEPGKYSDEGTFRYGDCPNTYVRVHVTHIPVVTHSSHRSSCAHSSCACAHSCACACACACAGGGRAGCSTKDFYNTNLKLSQLMKKKISK